MNNKRLIRFQSWNVLLIFAIAISLLTLVFPLMVSASTQTGTQGSNAPDSSSSPSSNPNQEAINHINQAQSALQNGDTAGAQMHMDSAKQVLGCNKIIDPNC